MIRLIIAGSRDHHPTNADIDAAVVAMLGGHDNRLIIISGGAPGVDAAGERWGRERDRKVRVFPADWSRYGKGAGKIRNQEMEREATHLLAFWDGMSPGTAHMIATMVMRKKPAHVVLVRK